MAVSGTVSASKSHLTIVLCFLAAFVEGIDLQSGGIAGPGINAEFKLGPSLMGFILSGSYFGLICGATLGGWLADSHGRKRVLVDSMVVYGFFALATTWASDFPTLLAARLLCGVGLGGALANLVALTAEAAGPARRNKAVALMYCGLPLGSLVSSGTGAVIQPAEWRYIFDIAGIVPLLVAPVLMFTLPESELFLKKRAARAAEAAKLQQTVRRESTPTILFGEGRATTTILLWIAIYFPPVALNLLLNWLPSLLAEKGFTREPLVTLHVLGATVPFAAAGLVQMSLNAGSAAGLLTYGILNPATVKPASTIVAFTGVILAMLLLAYGGNSFAANVAGAAGSGFFISSCNLIVLAAAPMFYATLIRGTGVGAAVSLSRFGSATGAIMPGQLLALGLSFESLYLSVLPGIVFAGIATLALLRQPPARD